MNFSRVNLRLIVAFLLLYVLNVILYFTWITPDIDLQPRQRWKSIWNISNIFPSLRLKIFDNFEELNISGLVETGGETILLLSEKIGNISNRVFTNISRTTVFHHILDNKDGKEWLKDRVFTNISRTTVFHQILDNKDGKEWLNISRTTVVHYILDNKDEKE